MILRYYYDTMIWFCCSKSKSVIREVIVVGLQLSGITFLSWAWPTCLAELDSDGQTKGWTDLRAKVEAGGRKLFSQQSRLNEVN